MSASLLRNSGVAYSIATNLVNQANAVDRKHAKRMKRYTRLRKLRLKRKEFHSKENDTPLGKPCQNVSLVVVGSERVAT